MSAVSLTAGGATAQPAPTTDPPPIAPPTEPVAPVPPAPEAPPAAEKVTITGVVRAPDLDAPLAGATISIAGTSITATTDDAGKFTLSAPPGQVTLRADFSGFRSQEKQLTVTAGSPAEVDFPLSLDQLLTEVIVVVGSRTPRTNVETTAPVDVVTAEDIAHVGKTETGRVLSTLAPSYVSTPQSIADGTDHVDPASLRGLGPDQVLVLVNGKRRHKSALLNINGTFGRGTVGTDLNAIASGSIKRIEILRDGAASQYGSDAIAGVINIVTKDYADILDINTMTGMTGERDGEQIKTSVNYGFKVGKRGFINVTGEFLKKNPTNRAGTFTGPIYATDKAMDDAIIASKGLTRDSFRMKIGEASAQDASGSYNLELPINDDSTFYSFGDLAHRNGSAGGVYRYPIAISQIVPTFYPDGFLPEIRSNIDDLAVTAGIRRKGAWTVDASITHGQNSFQFNVENSNNSSLGTLSPQSFDAGTITASQTIGDLDILHKFDTDAVKSLALVFGTEVRTENYQIKAGDQASWDYGPVRFASDGTTPTVPGAQVFPGFQPANEVDRIRNNVGVYAGVETEVIKGLNIDIGGRYENYSDFGNSYTGKAAARVPIGKMIALRAAVSNGFRSPSLQQLWFSNISTLFSADPNMGGALVPAQTLLSNNASPITKAFGIPELKEERSTNLSGGITVRPFENLSLTADGYFIRIKDRITLTNQFQDSNAIVKSILTPFPGVTRALFFANAIDTDTKGLDVVADYAVDTGAGTLTLSAAANFTKTEVKNVHIPGTLVDRFGADNLTTLRNFYFSRLLQSRLEDAVPHQKGNVGARYAYRQLTAVVRANYYGKVRLKPDNPDNDETFGAKVLFDAELGFQITKNLQLSVGADNLLNTFPDKIQKAANQSFGRFVYDRNTSQFGMNGGFYYGKLELTFF